jgi:hypothetical protein
MPLKLASFTPLERTSAERDRRATFWVYLALLLWFVSMLLAGFATELWLLGRMIRWIARQ